MVFDICLDISSDSKHYFGFVVDEFSKRDLHGFETGLVSRSRSDLEN